MKILPLSPALEPKFWEYVNQDFPHNYFFALDWKYSRDNTKILLALKENRIDGMMLTFKERIVQLRGSRESAKALLEKLLLKNAELLVSEHHEKFVVDKYQPTRIHELILMRLHKGEENLRIDHPLVPLDSSYAEGIAAMMNRLKPEVWGEFTREQIVEGMNTTKWFGIKKDGELVSIGRARLTERVGHIPTIATHEAHRNKGYATSITSYLVKLILENASMAILFTLSDNPSAIKVYKKVGFKPYKKYLSIKGIKR